MYIDTYLHKHTYILYFSVLKKQTNGFTGVFVHYLSLAQIRNHKDRIIMLRNYLIKYPNYSTAVLDIH